jgi:hypothetical protein
MSLIRATSGPGTTSRRATIIDILVAGILTIALKGEPLHAAQPEVPTHTRRTPRRLRPALSDSPTPSENATPSCHHAARSAPQQQEGEQ